MGKAKVVDLIGEVKFPKEDLRYKMILLVKKVAEKVSLKFQEGELEIYGHLETERRVGVMYIPPKKHWYSFATARIFIGLNNPKDIKEVLVKVSHDPKFISKELVAETKKLIEEYAAELNMETKEV
ncbi:hypothetical protein HOE37_00330 [Candidatus Woesearchaeota archaeon]|jgi:hypothetical protein|nr:hypothetical protein [Candidatus Woesearchaeota archaeon]MBT4110282.1 hypothetical protein [Candidatus Woesearchaeota archaeon]MBT4336194.1 hypothetical protein [Candidatus Woesearchaeota archaeon]MBT4468827.1 hypothetical protein [Candidatus Woesearchaeota archaeon]MBT6744854.1 hypothetical protein [Candidatus Woesearchaeota archaeon]